MSREKRAQKTLLHRDRYCYHEDRMVRHHSSLLPEVLRPMTLCVKRIQRNLLVLRTHRNRDLHRGAVLEPLKQGYFLEEMREVALPNLMDLLVGIWQARDSCD